MTFILRWPAILVLFALVLLSGLGALAGAGAITGYDPGIAQIEEARESAVAAGAAYQISGFASPGVFVLDTTAPLTPNWLVGSRFTAGALAYEARHITDASYLAVDTNAVRNPKSIRYYEPPNLRSSTNSYDYLLITHGDFSSAAQTLANYWTSQGLRTRVVDINDVYNEFNYGIYHSIAIKSFLAYTFVHWAVPPSYVLLIGDGHWNFKSYPRYNAPMMYMPLAPCLGRPHPG